MVVEKRVVMDDSFAKALIINLPCDINVRIWYEWMMMMLIWKRSYEVWFVKFISMKKSWNYGLRWMLKIHDLQCKFGNHSHKKSLFKDSLNQWFSTMFSFIIFINAFSWENINWDNCYRHSIMSVLVHHVLSYGSHAKRNWATAPMRKEIELRLPCE